MSFCLAWLNIWKSLLRFYAIYAFELKLFATSHLEIYKTFDCLKLLGFNLKPSFIFNDTILFFTVGKVCAVQWRMFSTLGHIITTTVQGHHQYIGVCSVVWGYHSVLWKQTTHTVKVMPKVLVVSLHSIEYPSLYWWYPHGTLDIPKSKTSSTLLHRLSPGRMHNAFQTGL